MKTHITTLNNMAGTASLAHRRVLKVAQSIGCHEMGLSFYPLKPDYAKEIDKRLDGIIAPLNYGDIVIFQYPSWIGVNYDESFVNKIKSYRDTKLIIFVQDIQKLMFDSEQAILDMEIKTLNKADLLILPSKKMHRYLKENGLDEKPVIYQTIWDMPSDICFVDHAVTRCFHFAGNYNRFPFLAEYHGKTPIYQYDANKPDRENDDSFCWRGYFEQEKLMHELSKGGFGLVWSDDEYFDRYYSMNQPYKLGTNLAAGIPVIVKRGCVHDKFVERNGLGYAVDTLDEADKLVQSITDDAYVAASQSEGFGLTLMEAIGSGLPIVGFDVRYGNQTFIDDGQNGYRIPITDEMDQKEKIKLLSERIVRMFTEDDMDAFSGHSYEKAKEYLTKEVVHRWIELLK